MTDPHHQYDQPWLSELGDVHLIETIPKDNYERDAELIRVVDGDTMEIRFDMGGDLQTTDFVRFAWVNTPEHRGPEYPAGHWVTKQLLRKLGDTKELKIRSRKFKPGKFGRYICDVYTSDLFLNRWLLESRIGWPADQDGRIVGGPRDIDRLTGIPSEIRRQVREAQDA